MIICVVMPLQSSDRTAETRVLTRWVEDASCESLSEPDGDRTQMKEAQGIDRSQMTEVIQHITHAVEFAENEPGPIILWRLCSIRPFGRGPMWCEGLTWSRKLIETVVSKTLTKSRWRGQKPSLGARWSMIDWTLDRSRLSSNRATNILPKNIQWVSRNVHSQGGIYMA
jgi:hypothetical protein